MVMEHFKELSTWQHDPVSRKYAIIVTADEVATTASNCLTTKNAILQFVCVRYERIHGPLNSSDD